MKRLPVPLQMNLLNAIKGTSAYRELSANKFVYNTKWKDTSQNKAVRNKAFLQKEAVLKFIHD